MARGKKGKKSKAVQAASVGSEEQFSVSKHQDLKNQEPSTTRHFQWWDYVVVGLFFVAFCEIQKHFAAWFIGAEDNITKTNVELSALNFLYGTMWKCFLIVLVLVLVYDYFYHDSRRESA